MQLLHICSYYVGNQLYKNLVSKLSSEGINQEIFIPIKSNEHIGKNQISPKIDIINYYYSNILNKYDRFLFYNKTKKQMKEVEKSVLANKKIDFIHAHTIFSDGGTAYKLYEKYGINYIVNVRNTDINYFYKYAIHLRPLMRKILLNSSGVVFISHAYKEKVFKLLPSKIISQIQNKCYVIPNGIDNYWIKNISVEKRYSKKGQVNLLFIGQINKNKNLKSVILTCKELRRKGYDCFLHVIGNGPLESKSRQLCKKLDISDSVIFHGYIKDKEKISEIMESCDIFIMPSYKETFGLVYIEAMSRGLPVIYTQGEGIDGFFKEGEVGFVVKPNSTSDISKKVELILKNYKDISSNCIRESCQFDWEKIALEYKGIYYNHINP
ncbi:glycosyltransferase [Clostridium sp. D2Q-11]|uniref:Glycosyltransferase n=1 Tax=Anaeromonas frigoriresistens TaxID=2683708 RepID=A0A942UWC1_9FIRM|nr:glycosyltransferase [Anaeromonas frigoriresistens]MBS4539280.1 glycosyltransferase [Anaeromonas frigoriresistens]